MDKCLQVYSCLWQKLGKRILRVSFLSDRELGERMEVECDMGCCKCMVEDDA